MLELLAHLPLLLLNNAARGCSRDVPYTSGTCLDLSSMYSGRGESQQSSTWGPRGVAWVSTTTSKDSHASYNMLRFRNTFDESLFASRGPMLCASVKPPCARRQLCGLIDSIQYTVQWCKISVWPGKSSYRAKRHCYLLGTEPVDAECGRLNGPAKSLLNGTSYAFSEHQPSGLWGLPDAQQHAHWQHDRRIQGTCTFHWVAW